MSHFYSHLVSIESILVELDDMDLSESEKKQLAYLVDANLHHTVLDAILSQLPEQQKERFLQHIHENDHDKIWEHLNEHAENIEEKIKKAAEDLKLELHQDIKEAKNRK